MKNKEYNNGNVAVLINLSVFQLTSKSRKRMLCFQPLEMFWCKTGRGQWLDDEHGNHRVEAK